MAFEASAIAPVRPAERLGDASGSAVGLKQHAICLGVGVPGAIAVQQWL